MQFFGFGHLNRSVVRGLGSKIGEMGCPDSGRHIGHFRGGFGSPGPIFCKFPAFFGHQYRGILTNPEGAIFDFLSLFDNLPCRPSKTRGRIVTRNGRKKRTKMGPKRLTVRPVLCSVIWARTPHSFRDWQFSAFGAGKAEMYPEA